MEEEHVFADHAVFVKDLVEAGGIAGVGSHGQLQGLGFHWEMWSMVRGGMSPMEALSAATINPARYLGLDRDIGSLEVGKLADLVIVADNPLEDIRRSDGITHVMLNGRLYATPTLAETLTGDSRLQPLYWQNRPEAGIR